MSNMQVLKDWFDRVDSDKTGSITAIQLQRALAVGNLQFPITIVQQMIRMYDFDRNGTMSFEGQRQIWIIIGHICWAVYACILRFEIFKTFLHG
ncbi:putative EF-hand domain-containing protein [Helianthus debilis subsp. tardiflorus]